MFKINATNGQIQTYKKLTGYSGEYLYTVVVSDNGGENSPILNNKKRTGNCTIRILVKDFNAHAPKFIFPDYNNSTIRIKAVSKSLWIVWFKVNNFNRV